MTLKWKTKQTNPTKQNKQQPTKQNTPFNHSTAAIKDYSKIMPVPLPAQRYLILKEDKTPVCWPLSLDMAHIWGERQEPRKSKEKVHLLWPLLTDTYGGICSMRTVCLIFVGFFPEGFKCFSLPPYRKRCLLLQVCGLIYSMLRSRIKGRWSQTAVNS